MRADFSQAQAPFVSPGPRSTATSAVLVVEHRTELSAMLSFCLEKEGYEIVCCDTPAESLRIASRPELTAVLVNPGIAGSDPVLFIQKLRASTRAHLIVLSNFNDEVEKVRALDAGANDYLVRPISIAELAARLRAAHRSAPAPVFKAGHLTVDFSSRTVRVSGQSVNLTATEFSLLSLFARNAGKVLSHAEILKEIWGPRMVKRLEYLRVYLKSLRRKIESNPDEPQLLLTERLVGYRLAVPLS